jgi:hypothetical protein
VPAKLDTTHKSHAWQVKAGWVEGRRSEIATFLPVEVLERPANSAHLAPRNARASSQFSDLVWAHGLAVVARSWLLALLRMASGLGGERPSRSTKVEDVKRRRLVEVVGNLESLGKNGRLRWHKDMERKRPFASKFFSNSHRLFRPSQSALAQVLTIIAQEQRPASGGRPA